jgi:hypothetical protein
MMHQLNYPVLTTAKSCQLHKRHRPKNETVEIHHIVPRGWQHIAWQPKQPWPDEAKDPYEAGIMLWDARTIDLCPTGHRNVHFYIVQFMGAWRDEMPLPRGELNTTKGIAMLALQRFQAVGGNLQELIDLHQWGQA